MMVDSSNESRNVGSNVGNVHCSEYILDSYLNKQSETARHRKLYVCTKLRHMKVVPLTRAGV